jgi:hypothetical protein
MLDAARLRDATQITLPLSTLRDLEASIESKFTVTVCEGADRARIIGSPVEIRQVSDYLSRRGVSIQ